MATQTVTRRPSNVRIIATLLMLFPAIMFIGIDFMAMPDLETWLAGQAKGFARPDAFDGVTRISPLFAALFGITSVLGAYLIVSHKSQYLLPLAAGPCLAALAYLVSHGFADPAWFTLLALLTIGMLVGSPVTVAWVMIDRKRHIASWRTGVVEPGETEFGNRRPPPGEPGRPGSL